MQKENRKKVVVIGGGPGGYPAAIKLARLGADVTLVDKGGLGGTCLQRGCIPTKYLLKAAKDYKNLVELNSNLGGSPLPPPDLSAMMKGKNKVVKQLSGGTGFLLKSNGVKVISGTGSFKDPETLRIKETGDLIKADAFLIAAGSKVASIPVDGIDLPGVLDSDKILSMETLPESLAIIGGGYIGLEFAQVFHLLGVKVEVIEMLPQIIPTEDAEVAGAILKTLQKSGIAIHTSARLKKIAKAGDQLKVTYIKDKKDVSFEAENVLVAVGRQPNLDDLALKKIRVKLTERKTIAVDKWFETSVPGIYAIGDVVDGPMLAHKATVEGETAAHYIMGDRKHSVKPMIPSVMYTNPEVARAGLTEEEAKEQYGELLIGRFPFSACGRGVIEGAGDGFVKVIAEAKYETIVGTSIMGPQAGHLIAEAALAVQMEASLEDVTETVHAHPTLSEAFLEAALDAKGQAIHIPPKKK